MNKFEPGQAVKVRHKDGRGVEAFHDATIVGHVKDQVWRVEMMGLHILMPEDTIEPKDQPNASQSGDAQIQTGPAS